MQTVWILAKNNTSAMAALRNAARDCSPYKEDIVAFRFIGTVHQVLEAPRQEPFIAVKNWRQRPDAEAILAAIKKRGWQFYTLREIFL